MRIQEFLDCGTGSKRLNSSVASHHQEAPVSEQVAVQKRDESRTDNPPHHPISAVRKNPISKHASVK